MSGAAVRVRQRPAPLSAAGVAGVAAAVAAAAAVAVVLCWLV